MSDKNSAVRSEKENAELQNLLKDFPALVVGEECPELEVENKKLFADYPMLVKARKENIPLDTSWYRSEIRDWKKICDHSVTILKEPPNCVISKSQEWAKLAEVCKGRIETIFQRIERLEEKDERLAAQKEIALSFYALLARQYMEMIWACEQKRKTIFKRIERKVDSLNGLNFVCA